MKTKFIALAGLAIVAAACNKENVPQIEKNNGRVTVSFNANTVDTKVVYTENADARIYNIDWSENEEVGLRFYNPADLTEFSELYKFTKGEGNMFTGEVEPLEDCDKVNVLAYWPYDAQLPVSAESTNMIYFTPYENINLESVQTIYPSGDDQYGHTLLLAAGSDREYNNIGSLEFKQMCSILKVNVTGVPAGAKVSRITVLTSGEVLPDEQAGYAGGYSLASRYLINIKTGKLGAVNRCPFLSAQISGTENGQDCVVNFPMLDTKTVMNFYHETGDKYTFIVTLSDGSTFEKTLTEKVMFELGHVYKLDISCN